MNESEDLVMPVLATDLVKMLNEVFPEKSPSLSDDTKTVYFKAGQRDVVRFINTLKERSENK
jgi:hypothetical protein